MAKPNHTKDQILNMLNHPEDGALYVNEAIRILGQNQTADELKYKTTNRNNDIGFSAAYGKVGTRFYEFVTGIQTRTGEKRWEPKSLSHPTANRVFRRYINNREDCDTALDYARHIAGLHWRQLGALLEAGFTVENLPEVEAPREERAPRPNPMVTFEGEVVGVRGKAYKVKYGRRALWLPKSQTSVQGNMLTVPQWLARNKGIDVA